MSEEDLSIDLTAKKKKKSKKPYDFGELDQEAGGGEDASEAKQDKAEIEDLDDELGDLGNLKKKKKKKKPFNLDELGGALPDQDGGEKKASLDDESKQDNDGGNAQDAGNDDFDFDFSTKKKKKKKKTTLDLAEADDAGADKENEIDGVEIGFEANDNGSNREDVVFNQPQKWLDSDRDYSYDEMLELIYNKIKEKNPESESGVKKKLVMRPPQVLRVGTKKTSFANFIDICKSLHRLPKHMQAFLLTELGTSGSVDANNQLIIKGRFQQKQIESVLRKYIKEYVACQTCRSPETLLQKETRLFFLLCETCGSRRTVANIKSGFQAVTGRRAAIRART